jgi:hypothetical protein
MLLNLFPISVNQIQLQRGFSQKHEERHIHQSVVNYQ